MQEVERSEKLNIIRVSNSPWRSPVLVVELEKEKPRVVYDYIALNEVTTKNSLLIPRINQIIDNLSKSKIFTTLDALSGYHHIELEEEDKFKTAFNTPKGTYEFNRMTFGLCNAPASYQRAMFPIPNKEIVNRLRHTWMILSYIPVILYNMK